MLGLGSIGVPTRVPRGEIRVPAELHDPPRGKRPGERGPRTARSPSTLVDVYRFREQGPQTRVFAVIGKPDFFARRARRYKTRPSPARGLTVSMCRFPPTRCRGLFRFADLVGIDGVSITSPYEEAVIPYLTGRSDEVERIGVCNIAVRSPSGWHGYNTAAGGFSESILTLLGRKTLRWKRVALIGAGAVARAVAEELYRLGARACILNRTELRAKELAERYRFEWGGLDGRGIQLLERYNSIIIQATVAGKEPDTEADPLALYRFRGRETVLDLIYRPEKTHLLQRAQAAGCVVLSGRDMLERQVSRQFKFFTGMEYPKE